MIPFRRGHRLQDSSSYQGCIKKKSQYNTFSQFPEQMKKLIKDKGMLRVNY